MTETPTESVQSPITITPRAAEKLCEVMRGDNKDPKKDALRVFVQGGGCSGFQYGLMINEESSSSDAHFESNGIKIVVDPISIRYVSGAEIDFSEDNGGFSVKNPNAKSTCGCGSSFNTD